MVVDVVPQDKNVVNIRVRVKIEVHEDLPTQNQILHESHSRSDSRFLILITVKVLSIKVVAACVESVMASEHPIWVEHRQNQEHKVVQE